MWFCNTLNFHGEGDFGFFDDTYYKDELFEPMLARLDTLIPQNTKGLDMVAFFANHPSKVRSIQFWDFNYYKGANPGPEEWKTPELRPLESMKTAQKNFRRLMQYLKSRNDIELTTFRALKERFSTQKESISKKALGKIARKIMHEKKIIIDDFYSPAEVFGALATALNEYNENGKLPGEVKIIRPFGPRNMPPETPQTDVVSEKGLFILATESLEIINRDGHLPSALEIEGKKIGTGSLLALFANAYDNLLNEKHFAQWIVSPFDAYPHENEENIMREVAACKEWPVHREDLDMGHLIELTKLQMWTLKPAWEKDHFSEDKP